MREVLDALNRNRRDSLAYTTVMTVMTRLAEKEILKRTPQGRAYLYEAVVPDAAAIAVRSIVRDFRRVCGRAVRRRGARRSETAAPAPRTFAGRGWIDWNVGNPILLKPEQLLRRAR